MRSFFVSKIKNVKAIIAIFIILIIGAVIAKNVFFTESKKTEYTAVKFGEIKQELTLSGEIKAEENITLQFPTGGKVAWVGVKTGDWVKKYQAVASLETEKFEAVLRQAQQDFVAAKAESEKYYDGHTDDPESFDDKIERTAIDAAQNKAYDALRIAQENLKDAMLYSPFAGLATRVDAISGTNIYTPTQGQIEIVNPESIYFSVNADQTEISSLKEGQKTYIIFDAYPNEEIKGAIKSISFSPKTDEAETVYEIKVEINETNTDYKYKLGMTGDASFITKEKSNAFYLPSSFVKSDDKGQYVLLGNKKEKKYVKTGIETDLDIEIISGLNKGDVVYD